jgi:hypothetical protein
MHIANATYTNPTDGSRTDRVWADDMHDGMAVVYAATWSACVPESTLTRDHRPLRMAEVNDLLGRSEPTGSIIRMHNGATVIRADLRHDTGIVLALSHGELVVWRVERDQDDVWHAFNGDYFRWGTREQWLDARERAIGRYDYRRGAI